MVQIKFESGYEIFYSMGRIKKVNSSHVVVLSMDLDEGIPHLIDIREVSGDYFLRIQPHASLSGTEIYTLSLDGKIYGDYTGGKVTFGNNWDNGDSSTGARYWSLQGIGISDVTDIKPSGGRTTYKLYQTLHLIPEEPDSPEVQITYTPIPDSADPTIIDEILQVRFVHREDILHIRINP